ncbi:AMP-binding protein, partial [Pseudoalteromonas sp. P1-9]|uniref:AMP-binding protein n=1 Tax=Pseudoalteromonas sp. P1-9 TaxID=1710354 RepID=UPI000AD94978
IFLRSDESFEFIISFHHSILDGWSRVSLTTELYRYYTLLLKNELVPELAVDVTFSEFVYLERQAIKDVDAKRFFLQMLENAPTRQLTQDMSKKRTGNLKHFKLPGFAEKSSGLVELAKSLGVPLQSVLLAGHLKVLSLFSGLTKAVSCITVNGRPESDGAEQSLGLYLNSIPMCVELNDGSWLQLIEDINRVYSKAIEYRRLPLANIQKLMGSDYEEISFNYTHFHALESVRTSASEQDIELLDMAGYEQTNFPLQIDVSRDTQADQLNLALSYDAGYYSDSFIENLASYYGHVYGALIDEPSVRHLSSSFNSEAESHELIVTRNSTAKTYNQVPVIKQFELEVDLVPEQLALRCGKVELNYKALNEKANRLANYLIEHGVSGSDRIGVALPRTADLLIAVLAVMKTGASYVAMEPSLPQERLTYIAEDANLYVILACSNELQNIPVSGVELVMVDNAEQETWLSKYSSCNPGVTIDTEDEVYVLYTSGSTGEPKGVSVAQRGLSHYVSHA